jgi:hypothetical protein
LITGIRSSVGRRRRPGAACGLSFGTLSGFSDHSTRLIRR